MADPTSQPARKPRRTLALVTAAAIVAVAVIGVGVYGLLRVPGSTSTIRHDTTGGSRSSIAAPTSVEVAPSPIPPTAHPEAFARRIAAAVFTWDTTAGYEPTDYAQQVLDAGDPSGVETPGLAADLADYLPDTADWAQLRQYGTRQWLTIDTATVPSSWGQALQQGQATLLPGTTAYTITATRHRSGVWDGKPVTTSGQVSFTVFETCQPTYPTCRVLRLSQLDNPLH